MWSVSSRPFYNVLLIRAVRSPHLRVHLTSQSPRHSRGWPPVVNKETALANVSEDNKSQCRHMEEIDNNASTSQIMWFIHLKYSLCYHEIIEGAAHVTIQFEQRRVQSGINDVIYQAEVCQRQRMTPNKPVLPKVFKFK